MAIDPRDLELRSSDDLLPEFGADPFGLKQQAYLREVNPFLQEQEPEPIVAPEMSAGVPEHLREDLAQQYALSGERELSREGFLEQASTNFKRGKIMGHIANAIVDARGIQMQRRS